MNTFQKTSLRASVIAATIAAMPFSVQAAGLGRISVLSALGQPLRAEIELNATADEIKSMTAAVAAPEAFKAAKLSYAPALVGVRMAVEQRGGKSYVRLSSSKPVNDPFVSLLVELNWQAGRLLREYTFLLDPPAIPAPRASSDVATAPVAQARPAAASPARSAGPRSSGGGDTTYTVRRGDTLGKIAGEHLPAGVSMDQMLVAFYRSNPEAFVDNNVNRLRSGVILNVPDAAQANAVAPSEARREVVAHAADFAEYRRRVAARVAESAPEAAASSQTSSGKITAKVEEPMLPSAASKDQVKVSKSVDASQPAAESGGAEMAAAGERLKSLEEDLIARDKALREANERLSALEANIAELQKLIALKNENLAALQKQASTPPMAAVPSTVEPTAPEGAATPAPAVEDKPAAPSADAAPQDALDKELKALVAPEPAAEAPAPAAEPAPVAAAPEPPAPAPKPAPAPAAPPPESPGFLDALLENPATLYGGGGVLALLLGYGLFRSRKNRNAGAPDATATASVFPPDQNSVFGETGGQSVDTGSSSLIQTDFSQSGLSAIDADEGVDPVAEADVYMAYGRDAQAEEILLDSLKGDPNRTAVHVKLLEIYSQRKNMKQFETTATELYSVTGGNGPDWAKAVEMGRKLDPENPLFLRGPQSEIDLPLDEEMTEGGLEVGARAPEPKDAAFSAPEVDVPAEEVAPAAPKLEAASDVDAAIDGDQTADMSLDFSNSVPSADAPSPSQLKDTWAIPGELNEFTDSDLDAAAEAQGEVPAATPEAAAPERTDALDSSDLDFNLDLDEVTDSDASDAASMEATEVAGRPMTDGFTKTDAGLEFNLELPDADEDTSTDTPRDEGVASQSVTDTDVGQRSGIDFNTGEEVAEPDEADKPDEGAGVSVVDLEKTNFDGSLLDFDFDLDEGKPSAGGEDDRMMATSLDLSDISLDLEGADEETAPAAETEASSETTEGVELPMIDSASEPAEAPDDTLDDTPPVFDEPAPTASASPSADAASEEDDMMASLSKSVVTSLTDSRSMPDLPDDDELSQEVDTKLELARAYEEMGDAEGARELLDEVIRDGNEAQQEQARAVFARLG
ncbi:FimV/HubP family polar landmark protein [Denitromonas iodatirespirans]|uniref:LysM domain-containing protein n=1 Tax=Denitromonas iodatirespirans TaxID=2795389 RepID=A0A944H731_DENI1|nr:FimV/HubP family polar landmark protein [Denitromonas iodatirespirans]MBT0960788.1 hypothetical protein [Denitromonas iodatirespirans]